MKLVWGVVRGPWWGEIEPGRLPLRLSQWSATATARLTSTGTRETSGY
jgi:hypothetical protein